MSGQVETLTANNNMSVYASRSSGGSVFCRLTAGSSAPAQTGNVLPSSTVGIHDSAEAHFR